MYNWSALGAEDPYWAGSAENFVGRRAGEALRALSFDSENL